jgi:hypothetical protein
MKRTPESDAALGEPYIFTRNDAYDRHASIQFVVPQMVSSRHYMRSIREFPIMSPGYTRAANQTPSKPGRTLANPCKYPLQAK